MILTPTEYHRIAPGCPFTRPLNLSVLVPNPAGTAAQIASAEDTHLTTKEVYLETLLLKRTIIQKTIEAVDTRYLSALRNHATGKITPLVLTILNFLYDNYGRVTRNNLTTIQLPSNQ